jgi:hypothetical protein
MSLTIKTPVCGGGLARVVLWLAAFRIVHTGHQHRYVDPVAAEQRVQWPARDLARQIPEGHIDGADRPHDHPAPADMAGRVIHRLPQRLDRQRVTAFDQPPKIPPDDAGEIAPRV